MYHKLVHKVTKSTPVTQVAYEPLVLLAWHSGWLGSGRSYVGLGLGLGLPPGVGLGIGSPGSSGLGVGLGVRGRLGSASDAWSRTRLGSGVGLGEGVGASGSVGTVVTWTAAGLATSVPVAAGVV